MVSVAQAIRPVLVSGAPACKSLPKQPIPTFFTQEGQGVISEAPQGLLGRDSEDPLHARVPHREAALGIEGKDAFRAAADETVDERPLAARVSFALEPLEHDAEMGPKLGQRAEQMPVRRLGFREKELEDGGETPARNDGKSKGALQSCCVSLLPTREVRLAQVFGPGRPSALPYHARQAIAAV